MKHALPDNAIIIDGEMHELVEADGYELICTRVHGADAGTIYKRRYL